MWVIGYRVEFEGWCVVQERTGEILAGPYDTHAEAVEAAQTMAFRAKQGWKP